VQFRPREILYFALTTRVPVALNNGLLPAQERIGLSGKDIPDVGRVARARIGDRGYVPACS